MDAEHENRELFTGEPRKKKLITAGRVVNALIALDYILVLLTALIVSGIFGVLDLKVA